MTLESDDILDDLFAACALAAFLEQAAREQGWPDSEATRRRAYRLYEEALAEKNRVKDGECLPWPLPRAAKLLCLTEKVARRPLLRYTVDVTSQPLKASHAA